METRYLTKFDEKGFRETSVAFGVHYANDEEKKKYLDEGYVETSDEDYDYYVGNKGSGANGTGYVRDPHTGVPVDAPPAPPVDYSELPSEKVETSTENIAALEAILAQEERIAEQDAKIAALEKQVAALKK